MKTYDQDFLEALKEVRKDAPLSYVFANKASNFLAAFIAGSGIGGIAGMFAARPTVVGCYEDEIIMIDMNRGLTSVTVNPEKVWRIKKSQVESIKKLGFPIQLFVTIRTKDGEKIVLEINKIWLGLSAQRQNWKKVRDLVLDWAK